MTGTRNPMNGDKLWNMQLNNSPSETTPIYSTFQPIPKQTLNVIIRKQQTKKDLAKYLHAACFAPKLSTLTTAIKNGQFNSWPGLTTKLLKSLPKNTIETTKAHIDQERQNLKLY